MTSEGEHFSTAVSGVAGVWPQLPSSWSYSSLSDAEECPRRWALTRASYPDIWKHGGYPPRPILPALAGDVIHRVLELILRGLRLYRCESLSDKRAIALLRELGGYTGLIENSINERLSRLKDNPRTEERLEDITTALRVRVPDMRQRVQAVLARTTIKVMPISEVADSQSSQMRTGLREGSYPEVELRAPTLRFVGRVDLLTIDATACAIVDYKSGMPNPGHAEQLAIYALLWSHDVELNPQRLPVGQMVLAYSTHDVVQPPPTTSELEGLATDLKARIATAENEQQMRPPPARPSPEACGFCSVRHLCEDYWSALAIADSSGSIGETEFIDAEIEIVEQNGPRSWVVQASANSTPFLLRTYTEKAGFRARDRVRLIEVVRARDDESESIVITMTRTSEAYVLRSRL